MLDYESIKQLAKDNSCSVSDLLVLSPNNDPFYVGTPGQVEKAEWFARIYQEMGSPENCHIRRVHYWLVSKDYPKPDGATYENTEKDWQLVTIAAKYARYLELIPVENIIDRRNPDPIVHVADWEHENPTEVKDGIDAEEIVDSIVKKFHCFNPHKTQAYHLEVWCEKSTMNDVLEPLCQQHGMNLVTGLGELSITAVHQLIERIHEYQKPVRIFYISDFDPAGECMPVSVSRKIEYFVKSTGIDQDVRLIPLMLTAEQCDDFKLPRTPIKPTESRKAGFESRHGRGATELDALEALHPGQMARILSEAIDDYFDVAKWNEAVKKNKELRETVREHLQQLIGEDLLTELDLSEFDEFEPGEGELIDDDDRDWLYDSNRDYVEQLKRYRRHKR